MRDSRRDSSDYNALRDAHDIAVSENTPSGSDIVTCGAILIGMIIIVWGFGKITGGW
jgi:hypothetical protein